MSCELEIHNRSGDGFVVCRNHSGVITGISTALHYSEYRDTLGKVRVDQDWSEFDVEPVDEIDREHHAEFFAGLN
jgi:hypothetical protein